MEKFMWLVLYVGLVNASLVPQHVHIQEYPHHGNQFSNGDNVVRMSDFSRLRERIHKLQKIPDFVSVLEESTLSLKKIPDLGKSVQRISDLERLVKDMTDSMKYKEAQESIGSLELLIQTFESKFESLEQRVQNLQSSFSSRAAPVNAQVSQFSSRASDSSDSFQSALDSECICGLAKRSNLLQIVGGVETEVNEYPWQAFLDITFEKQFAGSTTFRCGGSVISDQWILTAAHCFNENGNLKDLRAIQVTLGDHDLITQFETESLTLDVSVDNVYIYPEYENNNGVQNNDYALIKLDLTIDWARYPNIRPICIPSMFTTNYDEAIATGWGYTVPGVQSFPERLQEVTVKVIPNERCNVIYEGIITDNMICAGNQGASRDACSGDSGGPLIATKSGNSGVDPGQNYELYGISSFGPGCGIVGRPGVYSRVSGAIPWISTITRGTFNGCPRLME